MRKVWSGERNLRSDERRYQLAGAQPGPSPPIRSGSGWEGADQMPRFAEEVVPALRARVAAARVEPSG